MNRAEFVRSAASPEAFIRDSLPRNSLCGKIQRRQVLGDKPAPEPQELCPRRFTAGQDDTRELLRHRFGRCWFVDLPGYGYAAVGEGRAGPLGARSWRAFLPRAERISLGVHIVDARHKPTGDDVTMSEWFKASGRPFVVVANKVDKLSKTAAAANLEVIRETLSLPEATPLIAFSAEQGRGPRGAHGRDPGAAVNGAGWAACPSRSCSSPTGLV